MHFHSSQISPFLVRYYGLEPAVVRSLNGYSERNFFIRDAAGRQYVLKAAGEAQELPFLEAQCAAVKHLSGKGLEGCFPECIPATGGAGILSAKDEREHTVHIRLLRFIDGDFLASAARSRQLLENIGAFLGKMDRCLADFSHPGAHRDDPWDLRHAADAEPGLSLVKEAADRRVAAYFLSQFGTFVLPALAGFRKAIIHNDANDYNLLVKGDRVAGLIDFGDMVYSQLVNNLAIALTYVMLDEQDPLAAAAQVAGAYHRQYPLQEEETETLYHLIAARLCVSLGMAAVRRAQQSDNPHHYMSEQKVRQLLHRLIRINPVLAARRFRQACGWSDRAKPANTSQEVLLHERREYIGPNLSLSYRRKIGIIRGALQYLYDGEGNTYVDCVNNVSHIGHCHPALVKTLQRQVALLNTNTRYLHPHIVEYARQLGDLLPAPLKVCYFTNSGSEANDLAVRMARHYTGRKDMIVLDHAYHGTSAAVMELSPYKFDGPGGSGCPPHTHKAEAPDLYRGRYKYGDPEAGEKYAQSVQQIIGRLAEADRRPAAFISETLQGVGGQWPLPEGYLKAVYEKVRGAGGLCIADEVQVGFGRMGEAFWGFALQGVLPDMVVLGKPMGNGHPLAAVVTTPAIAEAFHNGTEYFNTFGGNPVSMAAGLSVLEVIREERLQEHALETGGYLLDGLKRLQRQYPVIGDVRGKGLFIGAEFVKDPQTLEPAAELLDEVVERMKESGFLLGVDGPLHNVLKIKPPLVFSRGNAAELLSCLDKVMKEVT